MTCILSNITKILSLLHLLKEMPSSPFKGLIHVFYKYCLQSSQYTLSKYNNYLNQNRNGL